MKTWSLLCVFVFVAFPLIGLQSEAVRAGAPMSSRLCCFTPRAPLGYPFLRGPEGPARAPLGAVALQHTPRADGSSDRHTAKQQGVASGDGEWAPWVGWGDGVWVEGGRVAGGDSQCRSTL